MSNRKRITATFDINVDMVPGSFYDPQDFLKQPYFLPRLWDQYNGKMISSKIEDVSKSWGLWRHRCEYRHRFEAQARLISFGADVCTEDWGFQPIDHDSPPTWCPIFFRASEDIIDRILDAGDLADVICIDTKTRYRSVPVHGQEVVEEIKTLCVDRAEPFTVVFLDMDDFKAHAEELGDDLVTRSKTEIAAELRKSVRLTDIVSHYKDPEMCDELLVVLKGVDWERAPEEVQSLLEVVPTACFVRRRGVDHIFTASAGYTVVDPKTCVVCSDSCYIHKLVDDIIETARAAEDEAKLAGKNCYSGGIYSPVKA